MSRESAFTIVELLISVSIFAGVVAGSYLCLRAGLASREIVSERMDVAQTARVALRLLGADLRAACRLDEDFEFVGVDREVAGIEADNVDFATHNWIPNGAGQGDTCEISWFVKRLEGDERSGGDGGYGLFRRRDPSVDREIFAGGAIELIAPGLRGFRLEYSDGFLWYDSWGRDPMGPPPERESGRSPLLARNLRGLPDAVRITLMLAPQEDGRARRDATPITVLGEASTATAPSDAAGALVFQTVVRLDFAPRVNDLFLSSAGSGAASSAGDGAPSSGGGS